MRSLLIGLLLVPLAVNHLVACGVDERSLLLGEDELRINPTLLPYVHEFEGDFGPISSSVLIGEVGSDALAVCIKQKGRRNQIVFSERTLSQLNEHIIRVIMYHEGGHCELNLEHSVAGDHTLTDPYTYTGEWRYYQTNWSALVADLKLKAGR